MKHVAVIANEPTPYRLHLHDRFATELAEDGFSLHFLFTEARGATSMPWFFQKEHQDGNTFFAAAADASRRGQIRLFKEIRDDLIESEVAFIVLMGYVGLVRRRLIAWAHARQIPLFVRGDSNILSDSNLPVLKKIAKHLLLRRIAGRVTGFMPMSAAGTAYFHFYGGRRSPCFLVPYEPDYTLWSQAGPDEPTAVRSQFGWTSDRRRMLFSGRMVPVKRVDIALAAFARVAEARPEWDLVLVGDGELRSALESSVPASMVHRVQWLGFRQADELGLIYRNCHLLVHPAEVEPWGLIMVEALAAGLPIVTTEVVGAATEVVTNGLNGYLVRAADAEAFGKAVLRATEPNTLNSLANAARPELESWRRRADPVDGLRTALERFLPAEATSATGAE